jgi:hypothetical protein
MPPAALHPALESARDFLRTHARLLERRVFEALLGGGSEPVVAALAAYQNADGGFGHALEPDLRCEESQPIFLEFALRCLREVGARAPELALRAADWLVSVCEPDGSVPAAFPSALAAPRADHWNGPIALAPSVERTFGLAAGLRFHGVEHRWLARIEPACLERLAGPPIGEAHLLLGAFELVATDPDRARAAKLFARLAEELPRAAYFLAEPPVTVYGLTPLHFAPAPDAPCRELFPTPLLEAHLDDLAARQQPDGGWPIFWSPPGDAARAEWRGRWTLEAVATLRAWGRL